MVIVTNIGQLPILMHVPCTLHRPLIGIEGYPLGHPQLIAAQSPLLRTLVRSLIWYCPSFPLLAILLAIVMMLSTCK